MFHFENTAIWTSEFSQCVTPKKECFLIEKQSLLLVFSSITISSNRTWDMFMRTCASSQGKERAFIEKANSRCFCWFPAAILVDQNGTPIWHLHTKLHKGVWGVLANNSETVCQRDLRLGQIVYILVFYNISFSWLLLFCFVTVKMIYTELICSKAYSPNMGRVDSDACTCIK